MPPYTSWHVLSRLPNRLLPAYRNKQYNVMCVGLWLMHPSMTLMLLSS